MRIQFGSKNFCLQTAVMMESDGKTDEFGNKLEMIVSGALSSLNIVTGLEVGLFETLSKFNEPKSYVEIAEKGKLKPRYVKELLGCMTSAGIVDIDPETEKYYLPECRRRFFDRNELQSCNVQFMELIPKMSLLREQVAKCYPLDGPKGVSPEQYKDYASQLSKISAMTANKQLVSYIDKVDGLTDMLDNGVECLDLACGTGHTTVVMAERFPESTFIGGDFMPEQLSVGRDIGKERHLSNITLQQLNAENLPQDWTERFDFVLCHYAIHDLGNPEQGLKEFRRVLKADGVGLIIDVNFHSKHSDNVASHSASIEFGFSEAHCVPASLWFDGGWGLGSTWGVEYATKFIASNGFEVKIIEMGKTVLYAIKKCLCWKNVPKNDIST